MTNNYEINLLSYLSKQGIGNSVSISHITETWYLKAEVLGDAVSFGARRSKIKSFLQKLESRRIIKFEDKTNDNEFEKVSHVWLAATDFEAQITEQGLNFLYLIKNQELTEQLSMSTIITNEKTRNNYDYQIWLLLLTAFLSLLSLIVSCLDYTKDDSGRNQPPPIESLKKQ